MSGPSIRVTRDFYAIRVFINDLLHVYVKTERLLGVHSWIKPQLAIEYVFENGGLLRTDYDNREKFDLILCGLEGVL